MNQDALDKEPEIWFSWLAAHARLKDHWPDGDKTNFSHDTAQLSHVTRKSVIGGCDQIRLKPGYSATDGS